MDFFNVLMLLGGVALFLFGMSVMSAGLEKTAGGRLEIILKNVTSNRFKAFSLGVGITSIIQSSSAVTVMLVGLVNSGIMQLQQTVGVIMGTNIGTTVTAWIISLTGLTGESFLIKILKPDNFSQIFAVVGIAYIMFSKTTKRRSVGEVLLGFAVLMAGMAVMRDSVSVLEGNEAFRNLMLTFSNPLLGVLFGAIITAILQSSSASVGILQAFSLTAGISFATAIPIILGMKIGTCITALLSSIGTNKNARRVAVVHIYFNVIGAIIFTAALYVAQALFDMVFLVNYVTPVSIAIMHTLLSVATTIILFPFAKQLEKLSKITVRGKPGEETKYEILDERLLATPTFAIVQCHNAVIEMCRIAREAVLNALDMVSKYNEKTADSVREKEDILDKYEDHLNTFLIKLSAGNLSGGDNWKVSELLHIIGDLERMGDHALNILQSAEELRNKDIAFSGSAVSDLEVAHSALSEIINMTIDAFERSDDVLARQVEPLEQVIDVLVGDMRSRHITRLQRGECSIIPGFVLTDLLINYERVSDHCSNMAISIIQTGLQTMERHSYLNEFRTPENAEFASAYNTYSSKYSLK